MEKQNNTSTRMKYAISIIFITFFISMGYAQNVSTYTIDQLDTWTKTHRNATQSDIITFLDDFIPRAQSVEDTYYILNTIINSYDSHIIPYTVYTLFAQIAELKFDFYTASLMYYTAYTHTQNPHYLFKAAIQEYQIGNLSQSQQYIETILNGNTKDATTMQSTFILQSEILLIEENPNIAYTFLDSAQYQIDAHTIDDRFLYQLYRLAKLAGKDNEAFLIHSTLAKNFSQSLSTQQIDNAQISPLPLPSLLFNNFSLSPSSSDNTIKEEFSPNASVVFAQAPNVGYQVGAFSNLQNAHNSLSYYHKVWTEVQINTPSPLLSKKETSKGTFYQVIFPLDSNEEKYQRQVLILKEQGVEGFVITQSD